MLKVKLYDIENLPHGTLVTIVINPKTSVKAVTFGKNFGLQSGKAMTAHEINFENYEVYLGWE